MIEEITIQQTANEMSSAVPAGQASTEAPTVGARYGAEREERTNNKPMLSWAALLGEAVSKPGFIHQAYSRFHNYSLGNQLLVLFQCFEREIAPGPLASFMKWKQLGRRVKKGEHALTLCMPLSCTRTRTATKDDGSEQDEQFTFTHFTYKNHWFVLSQTEGAEYQPPAIPEWNEQKALEALNIERIRFENLDGNTQGYARRSGKIAINPLAALPHKTFFHEAAYCLSHCQETDLTDTEQTLRGGEWTRRPFVLPWRPNRNRHKRSNPRSQPRAKELRKINSEGQGAPSRAFCPFSLTAEEEDTTMIILRRPIKRELPERVAHRQMVMELHPGFVRLREKHSRTAWDITWESIYWKAAEIQARKQRARW